MKTILFLGTEDIDTNHLWLATMRMAPNPAPSKHEIIHDMIRSGEYQYRRGQRRPAVTRVLF
jgi:hypothetical protein